MAAEDAAVNVAVKQADCLDVAEDLEQIDRLETELRAWRHTHEAVLSVLAQESASGEPEMRLVDWHGFPLLAVVAAACVANYAACRYAYSTPWILSAIFFLLDYLLLYTFLYYHVHYAYCDY